MSFCSVHHIIYKHNRNCKYPESLCSLTPFLFHISVAVGYSVDPNAAVTGATANARQTEFATVQPGRGVQDIPGYQLHQQRELQQNFSKPNMHQQMGQPVPDYRQQQQQQHNFNDHQMGRGQPGPDFRQQQEWKHQQQYTGGTAHNYQGPITRHDSGSSGGGHHDYGKQQSRASTSSQWSGSQPGATSPPYRGNMPPFPEQEAAPEPKPSKIIPKTKGELG